MSLNIIRHTQTNLAYTRGIPTATILERMRNNFTYGDRSQHFILRFENEPAALEIYLNLLLAYGPTGGTVIAHGLYCNEYPKQATFLRMLEKKVNCITYALQYVIETLNWQVLTELLKLCWSAKDIALCKQSARTMSIIPRRYWPAMDVCLEGKAWAIAKAAINQRENVDRPQILAIMSSLASARKLRFWKVKERGNQRSRRFWEIARRLPFDMQCKLAGMLFGGEPTLPSYDLTMLAGMLKI